MHRHNSMEQISAPSELIDVRVERFTNCGSLTERSKSLETYSLLSKEEESSDERKWNEDRVQTVSQSVEKIINENSEETLLKMLHDESPVLNNLLKSINNRQLLLIKAVEKNFLSFVESFLDFEFDPLSREEVCYVPLHTAIEKGNDEMAALIISKLKKSYVRQLFGDIQESNIDLLDKSEALKHVELVDLESIGTHDKITEKAIFKINNLIALGLDKTLLQVLDSLIVEQHDGQYMVHVKLLEIDSQGREPKHPDFDFKWRTAFQEMAALNKKDALNHPAVQTHVEDKWKKWCRGRFIRHIVMYLFSFFCWLFSAVTGVSAPDIHTYDTRLQHSRAVFEVIACLFSLKVLLTEIQQIFREKKQYFFQIPNYIDLMSSIILVFVLPPLRYTNVTVHWYVFAIGYCFWTIRVLKYSVVITGVGMYAEVIKTIVVQDLIQFSILIIVVNFVFSGTLLLIIKAEVIQNDFDVQLNASLFPKIMYGGLKTLLEASPVEYPGTDGYRTTGTMLMTIYMYIIIVALLNILIAQVNETYTRTHENCMKTVRANRARAIAKWERDDWHVFPKKSNRVKHYTPVIENVSSVKIGKSHKKQIKEDTGLIITTQCFARKVDLLSEQVREIKEHVLTK